VQKTAGANSQKTKRENTHRGDVKKRIQGINVKSGKKNKTVRRKRGKSGALLTNKMPGGKGGGQGALGVRGKRNSRRPSRGGGKLWGESGAWTNNPGQPGVPKRRKKRKDPIAGAKKKAE